MAQIVTDTDFQKEVIQSSIPVLVDFYADWCGPCKMLAPVLDQIAPEYEGRVKIVKVNVDNSPEAAQTYGVQSIPTLLFMKEGQVVNQAVGFQTKDKLAMAMNALL